MNLEARLTHLERCLDLANTGPYCDCDADQTRQLLHDKLGEVIETTEKVCDLSVCNPRPAFPVLTKPSGDPVTKLLSGTL